AVAAVGRITAHRQSLVFQRQQQQLFKDIRVNSAQVVQPRAVGGQLWQPGQHPSRRLAVAVVTAGAGTGHPAEPADNDQGSDRQKQKKQGLQHHRLTATDRRR
ncbi:hypothetical protein LSE82_005658, partial [Salmonella enterica]|nr:hypothetical protein [Salmonella enterica]